MDVVSFAVLGIATGCIYALSAIGLVVTYRGSGVVNFAHGAAGMVAAYTFYELRTHGLGIAPAGVLCLMLAAGIGASIHLVVMRPLRHAPPITQLIATLGLFNLFLGIGELLWGYNLPRTAPHLLPTDPVRISSSILLGQNAVIVWCITLLLTVSCWAAYRWTRFGLATSAVAESRRVTSAAGISPDRIAAVNWAIGGALGALSAVLQANISNLFDVQALTIIVVPALAAALVGMFRSFWLTLAGGLLIGILTSLCTYVEIRFSSVPWGDLADTVPFLVIIILMVARGRTLPLRDEPIVTPPRIGTGRARPATIVGALVVSILIAWFVLSPAALTGLSTSCGFALVIMSIVLLTGYTGQLSLMQFAIAGIAGWSAAWLVAANIMGDMAAFAVVLIGMVPFGILMGLPALRTRGVNLAVLTLGAAAVLGAQIFNDTSRSGGNLGMQIGGVDIFGLNIDGTTFPDRYAVFSLIVVAVGGICVAKLRRSVTGQRLLAVRSNERGAASVGISIERAKLFAFSFAAVLAGAGGILLTFMTPTPSFTPQFDQVQSISVVVIAVLAGVGYVAGGVLGGIIAPGALLTGLLGPATQDTWISPLFNNPQVALIIFGVSVLLVMRQQPDGIISGGVPPPVAKLVALVRWIRAQVVGWFQPLLGGRESRSPVPAARGEGSAEGDARASAALEARSGRTTLSCEGLTVRFGGVVALDDVTLTVASGEVVGVIGANGAGKTTLLDALTGFVVPQRGEVTLDGVPITQWSASRRANCGIRRSFQGLELFETMTVAENLSVASDSGRLTDTIRDIASRRTHRPSNGASAAADYVGVGPMTASKPADLSYGQRRLVAIARAMAGSPAILLLDEPASGLDVHERSRLSSLIRSLAREVGVGVLLIEHDVEMVMRCSDRVVALDFGRMIAEGKPEEVRQNQLVVDAYIGTDSRQESKPQDDPIAQETEEFEVDSSPMASNDRLAHPRGVTSTGAQMSADELLDVRGLFAGYGGHPVVRDFNVTVAPGEIVVLLGPNGAGKTTTLLTIAGELEAISGEMVRLGSESAAIPLHQLTRNGLGFIMEGTNVTAGLSARANLRLRGSAIPDRAVALFPELSSLLGRPAGLLSGGEQRILSLARALAPGPSLILADELSLGLAPRIVSRLLAALRAAADSGAGVLLVEQHAERALAVADRFVLLSRGSVVLEGPATDIRGKWESLADQYMAAEGELEAASV